MVGCSGAPLLACGLRLDGQAPQPLEVVREGRHLHGRLLAPWGREYAVRGLNGYEGTAVTSTGPTGYAISDGGTTLAVVDVLNGGRVHLEPTLDAEQRVYFAAHARAQRGVNHAMARQRGLAGKGFALDDRLEMDVIGAGHIDAGIRKGRLQQGLQLSGLHEPISNKGAAT